MLLSDFPDHMFELLPGEPRLYGDHPDVRAGVAYFRDLMTADEWEARRDSTARKFYRSLVAEKSKDKLGRFYSPNELFDWYLFLAEAINDHPQNYEVSYGSRVVPVFAAIGRNLPLVSSIEGFDERARRIVNSGKGQPNGGLFELLVALAYARDGAKVRFCPEQPGKKKTHDLDVEANGRSWAVECKRLEAGSYVEDERSRKRKLWSPASSILAATGKSYYANMDFLTEISELPDDHLTHHIVEFLRTGKHNQLRHDKHIRMIIGELDLSAIQSVLATDVILFPGPVYNKLLTGNYYRYDDLNIAHKVRFAQNPHYIDALSQAVVLRSRSISEMAVEKKARHIKRKLSEACSQLPADRPGVIHVGLEALGHDVIEARRHERIVDTIQNFDPKEKPLSYVFTHYFSPEASPEEAWAIDETFDWRRLSSHPMPLKQTSLLLPSNANGRDGGHWEN